MQKPLTKLNKHIDETFQSCWKNWIHMHKGLDRAKNLILADSPAL